MQEMLSVTGGARRARASATRSRCITDGRFSGGTHGLMIGHVAPEAALGGPIGLVEEGDEIVIDVDRKALDLDVPADVLAAAARRAGRRRRRATPAASWRSTRRSSSSASEGAVTTGAGWPSAVLARRLSAATP